MTVQKGAGYMYSSVEGCGDTGKRKRCLVAHSDRTPAARSYGCTSRGGLDQDRSIVAVLRDYRALPGLAASRPMGWICLGRAGL